MSLPKDIFARLRRIPAWVLLPVPFMAWALYCLGRGERRWEHVAILVCAPAFTFIGQKTRRMLVLLYPMGLIGLLYDSMRFFRDVGVTPDRVHLCDLRAIDVSLFGISSGGERVSLPEWFQAHRSPAADLYFAIPYGTFLFVMVSYAIYLYCKDETLLKRFAWSYFFLNVAGFLTYHIYPAAPPWYYAEHGCQVDMLAHASEGPNLQSVDAMVGFGFFHGLYGRSNDLFGAVPSLHVAYPILILFAGWKLHRWVGRALALWFFGSMTVAALYLEHHWMVDVVFGFAYGIASALLAAALFSGAKAPKMKEVVIARSPEHVG